MSLRTFLEDRLIRFSPAFRGLISYLNSGRRCRNPRSVDIELTNRCNLRCPMCWFHGANGAGDKYSGQESGTAAVLDLIDQLQVYGCHIYLGGAEPFIRRDLPQILTHIKNRGLGVSFTTNGTLLDSSKSALLVDLGVNAISISIDGDEASHDRIRGRGVYRKAVSAVKELRKYRDSRNSTKPLIYINTTISRGILGHIGQTIQSLIEQTEDAADFYRLHHLWFATASELQAHQHRIREVLNCAAPGANCHLVSESERIDPMAIAREISSLRIGSKLVMFPAMRYDEIVRYYSEETSQRARCISPFFSAIIKPNGDVQFCPDEWIDDYVLGNVRNDSFQSIWNGRKARGFRTCIVKHKSFPGCKRCSAFYASL